MRPKLASLVLIFAAGTLLAQTPVRQPSPDRQAFTEANAIKDPAEKVEALKKFLKEHPDSAMAQSAILSMMRAAAGAWPDDAAKLVALGDEILGAAQGIARALDARQIAASLLGVDKAPADAERFARMGVEGFTYEEYRKRNPSQTEVRARKDYETVRTQQLTTLALADVKVGKDAEARGTLEEVVKANPYATEAARGLATIASRAGNPADALRWTAVAYLAHPTKAERGQVEALYKQSHNGSLDGLETYLDTEYEKMLPNPAHLEPYRGEAKHTVLAELLTGSGCPPCVGMDLAFDALMERYPTADVAFLLYHQNRPLPDPMTNPNSMARFDYYAARGVPTYAIDGAPYTGGGGREQAPDYAARLADEIDHALRTEARATLELKASREGKNIPVQVKVGGMAAAADHLKLHIVVAEKTIHFSGESGIRFHPMVVRSVAQVQIALDAGASLSIDRSFDLDKIAAEIGAYHDAFEKHDDRHNPDGTFRWPERLEHIDADRLAVVAFLQDDATKAVLQAASVDLSRGADHHAE